MPGREARRPTAGVIEIALDDLVGRRPARRDGRAIEGARQRRTTSRAGAEGRPRDGRGSTARPVDVPSAGRPARDPGRTTLRRQPRHVDGPGLAARRAPRARRARGRSARGRFDRASACGRGRHGSDEEMPERGSKLKTAAHGAPQQQVPIHGSLPRETPEMRSRRATPAREIATRRSWSRCARYQIFDLMWPLALIRMSTMARS